MGNIPNQTAQYFRNDPVEPPSDGVRTYLDTTYFHQLPFKDIAHPKLLIVFSGGNAVGKSALAKHIEQELQALVIENDAIKAKLLENQNFALVDRPTLGRMTWNYTMELYTRLDSLTPNGLVVRDAVIDWYYDRILPIFLTQGYELFVIRFDVSRAKSIAMVQQRGDKDWISAEKLVSLLDLHETHSKRFLSEYTPDVTLNDDTLFEYEPVIAAIRRKLESLT